MDIPHLECCAREPVEKFGGGIEFEGEIEKRDCSLETKSRKFKVGPFGR